MAKKLKKSDAKTQVAKALPDPIDNARVLEVALHFGEFASKGRLLLLAPGVQADKVLSHLDVSGFTDWDEDHGQLWEPERRGRARELMATWTTKWVKGAPSADSADIVQPDTGKLRAICPSNYQSLLTMKFDV